jgi:uncharacterized FAD-dependent dehydrogenase
LKIGLYGANFFTPQYFMQPDNIMQNFQSQWDVIIGAGPAGLFAAYELVEQKPDSKILMIDRGAEALGRKCPVSDQDLSCVNCQPCNIMCGVGGAGIFSDGILNLRPDVVGGDLNDYTHNDEKSWEIVDFIDQVFLKFGAPPVLHGTANNRTDDLALRAMAAGIKFQQIKQRHLGSENTPKLIKSFSDHLERAGVKIMTRAVVNDLIIENGECFGVVLADGQRLEAKAILFAPGRIGGRWVREMVSKHNIEATHTPIDVGVRVEVPSIIMRSVIEASRDPKFHIWTKQFEDFVRTFCTNHEGFVVKESYDSFIGVNGHSYTDKKSKNTNFAFLVRVVLTQPLENTTVYGESIAKLATILGKGKPLIQRLGDLRRGRRSTPWRLQKSTITPTLTDATPGNIAMVLPHRILTDILEGLEKLNEVIPGVATNSTFLYAPEIKYYSMKFTVSDDMQTNIKNLYAAGDGAGLSRDIVKAAATGLLASRAIIRSS